MRFGSLFAGIGGFDLGLERAGMECAWQVEIDPFCRRVLEKHWPGVPRYRDVRTVDWSRVERVDLICGGIPCQPFSSASRGRKRGMEDRRWLWWPMFDAVKRLRPAWVLVENVAAFDGPALEAMVSDLESYGYEVAPPLEVPACAFGYDHRRARLWILGYSYRDRQPELPVDAKASWMQGDRRIAGRVGAEDGLSGGLDRNRLRALGNAIIPDIAQWIGEGLALEPPPPPTKESK